ncbi:MAG: hypothetical protein AAF170_15200 [Bacteroidota bacterium]
MRLFAALAALLLLAPLSVAQPGGDPVERLAQALELSDDQADLVAELLDPQDPGSSWTLAAELLPTLSDDQRETLFTPPQARQRRQGARRGGQRMGQGRRATRQPDPARQAVTRAARNAALELTDEQVEQLDAYEAAQREAGLAGLRDEAARAQARADLDAILSDDQMEIFEARRAIQRMMRRGLRRGARGI